jgi:hypothetical protein
MKSAQNQLVFFWDMKRKQLRLAAGGTVCVICVVAAVVLYLIIKHYS